MLDTFQIGTYGDGWEFNEDTGAEERTFVVAFTTPGRVKTVSTTVPHESQVGGRTSVEVRRELHIPVTSPATEVGMVARCIAVDATSDPSLLGAELTLAGPAPGSQTTARRLAVVEVIS